LSLSKIRGVLYSIGKYLGDIQAVKKSIKKGDIRPIITRILRRIYGKIASRGIGKIR